MKNYLKYYLLVSLALLLASCASPTWVKISKDTRNISTDSFKVTVPQEWMHWAGGQNFETIKREKEYPVFLRVDRVYVTLDGKYLEQIEFIRYDAKDAFPYLKREYTSNMLPSEAADLYVSELKKSGMENITVIKNEPAMIAGKPGFRLLLNWKNASGLRVDRLIYGFGYKSSFYLLSYEAPNLYYYPKHLAAFTEAFNSFKLVEKKD